MCAGSSLVSDVAVDSISGRVTGVTTRDRSGRETQHAADAVVFAIGIGGELCLLLWATSKNDSTLKVR